MDNKQPCQLCGTITENLQHATVANNGLIRHVLVCQRCYRDWETDRKSTRLNSSHSGESRMPSSA